MGLSLFLAMALPVSAVPSYPSLTTLPGGIESISEYFNLLAAKVQESRSYSEAPTCDLSTAVIPLVANGTLPSPAPGLRIKHIAIGRGTQNYTCDTNITTAAPSATGAMATLFNASCLGATYPDLLNLLPRAALAFNQPNNLTHYDQQLAPSNLAVSGHHFFLDLTTPYFDLDTPMQLGEIPCSKNASAPAPEGAPRGQQGEAAVPWLKLRATNKATGGLQEVYRVETAGGSAPKTCAGMPAEFGLQYAAQYWFFSS